MGLHSIFISDPLLLLSAGYGSDENVYLVNMIEIGEGDDFHHRRSSINGRTGHVTLPSFANGQDLSCLQIRKLSQMCGTRVVIMGAPLMLIR